MHIEEALKSWGLLNNEKNITRHYRIQVNCVCRWNCCESSVWMST